MANRLQLRRDGAQQWANVNPILAQGELGIEIDTSRIKIGDGVTAWNSLKYERPIETESNTANTLVKRDADGNFEAGAITASVIGNAATATQEELLEQFQTRYNNLISENQELAKKIKDNEATALKLLGAIETLQYLNPPAPQPTEVEEPAEVPAA